MTITFYLVTNKHLHVHQKYRNSRKNADDPIQTVASKRYKKTAIEKTDAGYKWSYFVLREKVIEVIDVAELRRIDTWSIIVHFLYPPPLSNRNYTLSFTHSLRNSVRNSKSN